MSAPEAIKDIGCIVMASGLSARYGRDKLLEMLGDREIILHTVGSLSAAGFMPLVVTRSEAVAALMKREAVACALHDGPLKSDTMRAGLEALPPDAAGWLFMPADQPLAQPASLRRLAARFLNCPARAVRLGFGADAGSPVLFPAACRSALLAYRGDRGGMDVLKERRIPCDVVSAEYAWELWDVDTPEGMDRLREVYSQFVRS